MLFLGLFAYRPVLSQSEPVAVTAQYSFGQRLQFQIRLPQGHAVTQLTLFLSIPASGQSFAIELGPDFLQENPVTYAPTVAELDIPPFVDIYYSVELVGPDGLKMTVPEAHFYYEDDRLAWQTHEEDTTIIRWVEGDEEVAAAVLATLAASRAALQERIPVALPAPLRIYLYPAAADLRSALRFHGRDWQAGQAIPELGVILVPIPNARTAATDLAQLLPHELSHLALYQALGSQYAQVPAWFAQGLATLAEGTPNPNRALLLEQALSSGTTIPIGTLCEGFPAPEEAAALASVQSGSLLAYIETTYGRPRIARLVAAYADGAGCEAAVQSEMGPDIS